MPQEPDAHERRLPDPAFVVVVAMGVVRGAPAAAAAVGGSDRLEGPGEGRLELHHAQSLP